MFDAAIAACCSRRSLHERSSTRDCWTKELGVSKQKLQQMVDKVGNSAAAVRKELAA